MDRERTVHRDIPQLLPINGTQVREETKKGGRRRHESKQRTPLGLIEMSCDSNRVTFTSSPEDSGSQAEIKFLIIIEPACRFSPFYSILQKACRNKQ